MNHASLPTNLLVAVTAALVLVPSAGAFDLFSAFQGPEPTTVAEGADLSGTQGKYQITNVTGITGLSVLSWNDLEMFLKPDGSQLEITMIPRGVGSERAVQTTTINDTSSLQIVTTPFYTYFNGAEATPPQLLPDSDQFDPSFITRASTPDVSVPNPVVLEDLKPRTITGPADMQTVTYNILSTGTTFSTPVVTILDIDDSVRVLSDPSTFAGATITEATTATAIQSMLEPLSLDGVDLNAVLNGLALSPDEIGIVNLAGLADTLATHQYKLRKVDDSNLDPRIEYIVDDRQIDLVNTNELTRKIVIMDTDELANVDEGKIIALKDEELEAKTRVLQHFKNGLICKCVLNLEVDPDIGGITDAVAAIEDANKRLVDTIAYIIVQPQPSLLPDWDAVRSDFKAEGMAIRTLVAGSTDQVTTELVEAMLLHKPVPPDPANLMPRFMEDMYVYADPQVDLSGIQTAELLEMIAVNRDNLTDFEFLFCLKCISVDDQIELLSYLGQLESFVPRQSIALPEIYPPDYWGVVFGQAGQLVTMMGEHELNKQIGDVYSTVRFRVISETTRLPISAATVTVKSNLPGWKGNSVQTFTVDTNQFGYAAVKLLPNVAYNFTVNKDGFIDFVGHGASPGPGETQGNDVRVTPKAGWQSVAGKAASPVFLIITAGLLAAGYIWYRKRGGLRRRRR